MPRTADGPVLDQRTLNRALLARQHLLEPVQMAPLDLIDHLVGLQAQSPWSPYLGMWARLDAGRSTGAEGAGAFSHAALADLLVSRAAVRVAVMRGTIHLVSAADALVLPALLAPVFERAIRSGSDWGKALRQWPPEGFTVLAEHARALLEDRPLTPAELGAALREDLLAAAPDLVSADTTPNVLAQGARSLLPLVQVPPRAVWGSSGATRWTTTRHWLAAEPADVSSPATREAALEDLTLRYLAAFGPASVADLQSWSGLTRLGPVVSRLSPRLVHFRSESGRALVDLPHAPRPDGDVPAPVVFLPDYDNLLIAHADRTRVISDDTRRRFATRNGVLPGSVLVDGTVRAGWRLARARAGVVPPGNDGVGGPWPAGSTAVLTVMPLTPLSRAERRDVTAHAHAVAQFLAPGAGRHRVVLEEVV